MLCLQLSANPRLIPAAGREAERPSGRAGGAQAPAGREDAGRQGQDRRHRPRQVQAGGVIPARARGTKYLPLTCITGWSNLCLCFQLLADAYIFRHCLPYGCSQFSSLVQRL